MVYIIQLTKWQASTCRSILLLRASRKSQQTSQGKCFGVNPQILQSLERSIFKLWRKVRNYSSTQPPESRRVSTPKTQSKQQKEQVTSHPKQLMYLKNRLKRNMNDLIIFINNEGKIVKRACAFQKNINRRIKHIDDFMIQYLQEYIYIQRDDAFRMRLSIINQPFSSQLSLIEILQIISNICAISYLQQMGQHCYEPPAPSDFSSPLNKHLHQIHNPHPEFATKYEQIPNYSQPLLNRLEELGEFQYPDEEQQGFPQGKLLNAYQLKNGVIYAGQWYGGKIHGRGKYFLPDGSLLESTTIENKVMGKGRIIYADGDYYQGEIKDNKATGMGRYAEKDLIYEGELLDNHPHGRGKQKGPDHTFEGDYENGMKKNGKYCWQREGIKIQYQGEFKNNLFDGDGVLSNRKGRYEGKFQNGKKKGEGKFIWADGKYFIGIYDNDMKNGPGSLFDSSQKIVKNGVWVNDKQVIF